MRSFKKLFTSIVAISSATIFSAQAAIVSADTISDKNAEIEVSKIQSNSLLKQINEAQNKVAKINDEVSNKIVAINDTQDKIDSTNQEITTLGTKIDKKQVEISKRKANLKSQVRSLQNASNNSVTGNTFLDFLLGSNDLSDLIGRTFAVGKLNSANQSTLQSVQKATKELNDLKDQQNDKKAQLVASYNSLQSDRDQLVTLKQDAQTSADDLSKKLEDNKDELSKLQGELDVAVAQKAADDAKAQASAAEAQKAAESSKAATASTNNDTSSATTLAVNNTSSSSTPTVQAVDKSISVAPAGNSSASGVVGIAAQYLGVPYVWGGTSPAGFDCSGLVQYVFKQAGVSLPRTSQAQGSVGTEVSLSALQPGDLLFWGSAGSYYHVAIYVGNGQYIHAPQPGENVKYGSIAYFAPSAARRV